MRMLIQRVAHARVVVGGQVVGAIGPGLLVLVGFEAADAEEDLAWSAGKLVRMRIFADEAGAMNLSLQETGGELLVVSQFTLFAATKKGNRPSFIRSAPAPVAQGFYAQFLALCIHELGRPVQAGIFGAHMHVELLNDGPVTVWVDSKARE